jgi:hypothetical protein
MNEYPIRAVSNFFKFSEIFADIPCATGVVDANGKWKKSAIRKVVMSICLSK